MRLTGWLSFNKMLLFKNKRLLFSLLFSGTEKLKTVVKHSQELSPPLGGLSNVGIISKCALDHFVLLLHNV